jgi:forkhead protein FKH
MKWQIAPEFRDEYRKKQAKRSGGSAPSSPASSKEVNPNFRGPNGQNLGYDTSMVTSFSAKDGPPPMSGRITFQPQSNFAPPSSSVPHFAPPSGGREAITPQRHRANTANTLPDNVLDESPLPHRQHPHASGPLMYNLPSSVAPSHGSPSHGNHNPTLSSSYIDTPFHHSQHSIITPAPMRQNPRLAPPSTLVAPSKFMPESSPAGPGLFWKGIMGVTPGQAVPDISPIKIEERPNGINRAIMSSSPPPMDGSGSPSKPARGSQIPSSHTKRDMSAPAMGRDGDVEMRSRSGSAAVGAKPENANPGAAQFNTNANAQAQAYKHGSGPPAGMSMNVRIHDEDDGDDDGGFDLAKGFAPITGLRRPSSVNAR